jgi:hypothetical protein
MEAGFELAHPAIDEALADLLTRRANSSAV